MAFRKTVRSVYEPSPFFGGFSESKFVNIEDGSSLPVQQLKNFSPSHLSSEALPLVSPDELLPSGQRIEGNVTFEPRFSSMQESATKLLKNIDVNNL